MRADLHIHSTVSDGSDSIEEIIAIAKYKGLDVIALTEHDTLSHMSYIAKLPSSIGLKVIAGVEMSAVHRSSNTRIHILGYGIDKPEIITTLTQPILEARNRNSEKQAEQLIQMGYSLDINKLSRADNKYLYKQHLMDWLVLTGQVPDMFGSFYYKTFKQGGPCAFDIEYLDVFDTVRAIKEAGGLAVLAHPGQQQSFWLIRELVRVGLDGIELNHHTHSEKDREAIRSYAEEHNLFLTGGSDHHGRYEPQLYVIGDFLSEVSGVEAIVSNRQLVLSF